MQFQKDAIKPLSGNEKLKAIYLMEIAMKTIWQIKILKSLIIYANYSPLIICDVLHQR